MIKFLDLQKINGRHYLEIEEAMKKVLSSGWYLRGLETEQFERNYAQFIGTDHAIGVGNGLDALTLILLGYIVLGVMSPGDEIIVPANTYIASIIAITRAGLVPVLVEPNPNTLQIDEELIEPKISSRTKGVMIVHLYGQCAYTDKIGEICLRHGLKLIEDNAQSHGAVFHGRLTGGLGDAAGHSFYPGKNLGALGDGGAVTTNDAELAGIIRSLGNYGSEKKYVFNLQGINSRIDELQAAILNKKLPYLNTDNAYRNNIARLYIDGIDNPWISFPKYSLNKDNVYHIFPIFSLFRDQLQEYLKEKSVETLIHYPIPPHKQKCFPNWNSLNFPITEKIHAEELSLPISPVISEDEAMQVISLLNAFKPA